MGHRPSLLSIDSALWLLLAASCARRATAHPYPKDDLHAAGYGYLMPRQCAEYCGYNNQYCCQSGSQCYTSNGIAGCSAAGGGGYAWYTTTWTETKTFTRTYSSFFPAATAPAGGGNCVPPEGSGQIACGKICCASWQYCAYEGQCMANVPVTTGGGGSVPTTIVTGGQTITTQFVAPDRVTGSATSTGTAESATTSTGAVSPGGSAGQLSGGAIAGIVVGTIAGVALLLLLCACFVVRGLWHGLLDLLGLRHKEKSETIIEEERYTRRGSTHSRRNAHGSWYGDRPSTVAARKEKSRGVGLLGLGAALGTLALLLGLRRNKNKKPPPPRTRSDVSSSYYWSDSYTVDSPSE
ncbi:uncharacterized protein THITE_2113003 [Thermothielavioides terrestris NRRL 8126]|uniref:Uncharacterized protein n=2 Tax=Thermothielavioides terrestris TaxID=2587410 RepID=G2R1H7_THETT|nr:uncharacterized protein THITE_2113003 [Thermothielavioides terrestris NRRL 8126]AEO65716.1 hypothetical protein THITE_2113003 [Thermothielavioides terrestris NRRL 8126]